MDEPSPGVDVVRLYRTRDGGQTWVRLGTVDWYLGTQSISFIDQQVGWATTWQGGRGILMHTTDGGRTWRRLDPEVVAAP